MAYWSFDSVSADMTVFYDCVTQRYNARSDNLEVAGGILGNALLCNNENFELIVENSIIDFLLRIASKRLPNGNPGSLLLLGQFRTEVWIRLKVISHPL